MQMPAIKAGPRNAITDVQGILVGQAIDVKVNTGVSVIVPETPCVCAVDVRGGGPGTREVDALAPETLVDRVDAVVLSGGSVYGLAAADGVTAALGAERRGFSLVNNDSVPVSPIVPAAVLYDLAGEGDKKWGDHPPYAALGRAALRCASQDVESGPVGAGRGARAGAYAGGIGTASYISEDGWQVGAIAAVNSFGSPYMPESDCFWAWPYEWEGEFGGKRPDTGQTSHNFPADSKLGAPYAKGNTTICTVAVNADLTKTQAKRLAIMAQDGLARAIRPVHAPTDGDVVFALATGAKKLELPEAILLTHLGNLAADCLARAIAKGVHAASLP